MKQCGIYSLVCSGDKKRYVGSSVDIVWRLKEHFRVLKKQIHYNQYLQSAFNKYGKDLFQTEVLELCESSLLKEREDYWIDFYQTKNPAKGFNFGDANAPWRGKKRPKELCEKLSRIRKEQGVHPNFAKARLTSMLGKKLTPEQIEKRNKNHKISEVGLKHLIECNLGRKHTPESLAKMRGRTVPSRKGKPMPIEILNICKEGWKPYHAFIKLHSGKRIYEIAKLWKIEKEKRNNV